MRKPSQDEVAATARARLEQLARELDRAGVTRLPDGPRSTPEPDPGADEVADGLPPPAVVRPAGRHAAVALPRRGATDRLLGLLPETLRGRAALDGGGLRVLVLLAVVAVALAGLVWARSHGDSTPVPAAAQTGPLVEVPTAAVVPTTAASAMPGTEPAVGTTAPAGAAAGSAGPVPGQGVVLVHVAGRVRDPGVVELPTGSRVVDALERAGGARRGVDLSGLNLARVLADGEQLLVGRAAPAAVPQGAGAGAASAQPGGASSDALVSLNTADLEQLDTLPGVGPVTAQKILDWRASHGVFSAVEELLEIDGIGDKTLAEIAPHVTL